ncbi:MAG: hypothetical protein GY863_17040 [bacterium]|nr:hypothetical protein [bacterium]
MRELRLYEIRKSKPFILDVALEYKRMIDTGDVSSQAELVRKLGLSRRNKGNNWLFLCKLVFPY